MNAYDDVVLITNEDRYARYIMCLHSLDMLLFLVLKKRTLKFYFLSKSYILYRLLRG